MLEEHFNFGANFYCFDIESYDIFCCWLNCHMLLANLFDSIWAPSRARDLQKHNEQKRKKNPKQVITWKFSIKVLQCFFFYRYSSIFWSWPTVHVKIEEFPLWDLYGSGRHTMRDAKIQGRKFQTTEISNAILPRKIPC